ncbi:PREDICTED: beta-glucosidase 13-like [Fragaria vesca subsp. vesca]|uniref:beta-glucosidase 13-like n=1 Tax=Fragaria vesca subsp. vesca TaxID=101020 RepID=UPI0002C2FCDE|nr:PREDICTED: beta-glucosidase 13-like [Fragaria vesca subsp. vesca]
MRMRPSSCSMEHYCWFCVFIGVETREYLPLFNESGKIQASEQIVRGCWFCRFYTMISCLTARTIEACFRICCLIFELAGQSSPPAGRGALDDNAKLANLNEAQTSTRQETISRKDFPADFKFGCATSALQTEGCGTEGGRGPATWDEYIQDGTPPIKIAVDSYHRYKEDVQLLKAMGVDTYRFSMSWSRILPEGTIDGGVNQEGIDFYNNFINDLIANGITPFATLFHFDLPTALNTKYTGFLSIDIVEDFKAYADLCFKTFGDRVKHWATINEPQVWGQYGFTNPDPNANAATDPFLSTHHVLLAHAAAAKLYKNTYQASQGGEIGIPLVVEWFEPFEDTIPDKAAARRAFDFLVGWFMEPLVYGDYPFIMKTLVKDGLPNFTDEQKELVKGSYDYIGVNYYTSRFAAPIAIVDGEEITDSDQYQHVNITVDGPDGEPIGTPTPGSSEIYVYPQGLKKALILLKEYGNPKFYITENGYPDKRDDTIPISTALIDDARIHHIKDHLTAIKEAMNTGTNVKAYLMWAMLDCVEMGSGYQVRFGLNFTNYLGNLNRTAKKSAGWLKTFLTS